MDELAIWASTVVDQQQKHQQQKHQQQINMEPTSSMPSPSEAPSSPSPSSPSSSPIPLAQPKPQPLPLTKLVQPIAIPAITLIKPPITQSPTPPPLIVPATANFIPVTVITPTSTPTQEMTMMNMNMGMNLNMNMNLGTMVNIISPEPVTTAISLSHLQEIASENIAAIEEQSCCSDHHHHHHHHQPHHTLNISDYQPLNLVEANADYSAPPGTPTSTISTSSSTTDAVLGKRKNNDFYTYPPTAETLQVYLERIWRKYGNEPLRNDRMLRKIVSKFDFELEYVLEWFRERERQIYEPYLAQEFLQGKRVKRFVGNEYDEFVDIVEMDDGSLGDDSDSLLNVRSRSGRPTNRKPVYNDDDDTGSMSSFDGRRRSNRAPVSSSPNLGYESPLTPFDTKPLSLPVKKSASTPSKPSSPKPLTSTGSLVKPPKLKGTANKKSIIETLSMPPDTDLATPQLLPEKSVNPHVQIKQCMTSAYAKYERCRACIRKNGDICRFKGFRTFHVDWEKGIMIHGPYFTDFDMDNEEFSSADPETRKKILRDSRILARKVVSDASTETALLQRLATPMNEIMSREVEFIKQHSPGVYFRPSSTEPTPLCESCNCEIFCGYWTCCVCGVELCMDCYDDYVELEDSGIITQSIKEVESGDAMKIMDAKDGVKRNANLIVTTAAKARSCSYKRLHTKDQMVPVYRIAKDRIMAVYEETVRRMKEEVGETSSPEKPVSKALDAETGYRPLIDSGDYLRAKSVNFPLDKFQSSWKQHLPIVMENIVPSAPFNPHMLLQILGDHKVEMESLSDASNNAHWNASAFMKGLEDSKFRPKDRIGNPLAMKISRYPTPTEFRKKISHILSDIESILPVNSYVIPTGPDNLSSRETKNFFYFEWGPRTLLSYGLPPEKCQNGSMFLQMEMFDTVHYLPYVSVTNGIPTPPELPAAIWYVFSPQDIPKIRDFLYEKNMYYGEDPLLEKRVYLTDDLLESLHKSTGIVPIQIHQNAYEAVYIPAGSLFQMKCFKNCMHISFDFLSAEHVTESVRVGKQVRAISIPSKTRRDMSFQVKSLAWAAWTDAAKRIKSGNYSG